MVSGIHQSDVKIKKNKTQKLFGLDGFPDFLEKYQKICKELTMQHDAFVKNGR